MTPSQLSTATTHFGIPTHRETAAGTLNDDDRELIRLAALDLFTDAAQVKSLLVRFAGLPDDRPDGTGKVYPAAKPHERTAMLATLDKRVAHVTKKRASISDAFLLRRLHEKLVAWTRIGALDRKEIEEVFNAYFQTDDKGNLDDQVAKRIDTLVELHSKVIDRSTAPGNPAATSKFQSPDDIALALDEYVIGQPDAKKAISIALYLHLLGQGRVDLPIRDPLLGKLSRETAPRLPDANLLVVGSTGSGKTFTIKTACELVGVDFLAVDCASLTSAGYKGTGLEEILGQFYRQCGRSIERVESGVIYFDEVDKLAFGARSETHGGQAVQRELLTFIEGTKRIIEERSSEGQSVPTVIDTSGMLFVFGGSFDGIEARVASMRRIGFGSTSPNEHSAPRLQPSDLVSFGIIPELMARIGAISQLATPTAEDLYHMLTKSADSPLARYEAYFRLHLDILDVDDEVLREIAKQAALLQRGGRGLTAVLRHLFRDYLFRAPNETKEIFKIDLEQFQKLMLQA